MKDLLPAKLGAILAFLAVALGAFGAHMLEAVLSPEQLATFETGVRYQMYHGLGLLAVAALPGLHRRASLLLFSGSVIFSGSLYLLVLADTPWLGAVAPVGGVLQLAGWVGLFLSLRGNKAER